MSNSSSSPPTVVEVPTQTLHVLEEAVQTAREFLSFSLNSFTVELVLFGGLAQYKFFKSPRVTYDSPGAYSLLVIAWAFPVMYDPHSPQSRMLAYQLLPGEPVPRPSQELP